MAESREARVAVVGVGTIGAMTLWQLAKQGVLAVGYDTFAPGHDRGAAGGESRIFRTAYKEGPQYVPLLREAYVLWRELEQASGRPLLHAVGCATVGPADHPSVLAVQDAARLHDLALDVLDADAARKRVPEHPVRDGEVMLIDPLGGLLRPEASVSAAVSAAEEIGAQVRRYSAVLAVRDNDGRSATVVTADGEATYDRVVVSPGPWAGMLDLPVALPLTVQRITATWFARRDTELFDLAHTPVTIRVGSPGFSCFPSVDGVSSKVIVHGGFVDMVDPDTLPRTAPVAEVTRATAAVDAVLPGLFPDPVRIGMYCDAWTPDSHALLGPSHQGSAVIIAAGFSGHGFKLAPAFGRVVAGLACGGELASELSFLDPSRSLVPA